MNCNPGAPIDAGWSIFVIEYSTENYGNRSLRRAENTASEVALQVQFTGLLFTEDHLHGSLAEQDGMVHAPGECIVWEATGQDEGVHSQGRALEIGREGRG